jgi:hypothetical protein
MDLVHHSITKITPSPYPPIAVRHALQTNQKMKGLLGKLTGGKKDEKKPTVVRNDDTRQKMKEAYEQTSRQVQEQSEKDKELLKQKNPYAIDDEPEKE